MKFQKVAIVGAGPAGAVALSSFLDHGFTDIRVFERRSLPGGTWIGDDELGFASNTGNTVPPIDNEIGDVPINIPQEMSIGRVNKPVVVESKAGDGQRRFEEPTLYRKLETNILPYLMSFKKTPVPDEFLSNSVDKYGSENVFRSHETMRDYVNGYFAGENAKYVSYNTTVEKAEQPLGPGTEWVLTLRRQEHGSNKEEWWTETFDGIYIAIGRYNVPRVSHIEGLKEVVKVLPHGVIEHTKWFRDAQDYKNKKVLIVGASISSTDIIQLVKEVAQLPLYLSVRHVGSQYRKGFEQPFVDARGSITDIRVNKDGKSVDVTFEDGFVLENVEKVVLATGYSFSYPFLEEYTRKYGGIVRNNALCNIFLTTWWCEDPSLAVPGVFTEGVNWRCMETQAMATAALWSGFPGSGYPSREVCYKWENDRRKFKSPGTWHSFFPYFSTLLEAIGKVGGGYDKLCEFSNIQDKDLSRLATMYQKGVHFKTSYWSKEANEYMRKYPESVETYNRTLALLESKTVDADPNINKADHEMLLELINSWDLDREKSETFELMPVIDEPVAV